MFIAEKYIFCYGLVLFIALQYMKQLDTDLWFHTWKHALVTSGYDV